MSKYVSIIIDWYGPYNLEDAIKYSKKDYADGLYMAIGKIKNQKSLSKLQYIGISQELFNRLGRNHHKIKKLSQECEIWLGEVGSYGIPGKKEKVTDTQLDLAEWLHVYFLNLPLNSKKKKNPPSQFATVLNRWWFTDYETLRKKRPHCDWPDIIDFMGFEYGAKIVWFGGRAKKIRSSDL